jgi:alkanesulfonate monooxygenase
VLISGSSEAGVAAARELGATAVRYPKPPGEEDEYAGDQTLDVGVRVGVIARPDADEAWAIAEERFPEDRKGELTHGLAMKVSDSHWHKQLSELGEQPASDENPYWLRPFQTYKTFCPYLVGSYERVARSSPATSGAATGRSSWTSRPPRRSSTTPLGHSPRHGRRWLHEGPAAGVPRAPG